jgi:hypothetical protein
LATIRPYIFFSLDPLRARGGKFKHFMTFGREQARARAGRGRGKGGAIGRKPDTPKPTPPLSALSLSLSRAPRSHFLVIHTKAAQKKAHAREQGVWDALIRVLIIYFLRFLSLLFLVLFSRPPIPPLVKHLYVSPSRSLSPARKKFSPI